MDNPPHQKTKPQDEAQRSLLDDSMESDEAGPLTDGGAAKDDQQTSGELEPHFASKAAGKGVLKKANEAIVMTPVSGKLIFLSRKLFNVLLYNAQQQGMAEHASFSISSKQLRQDAGFNSKDLETLKISIRTLMRTTIEWGWVGELDTISKAPKKIWSITQLLADAKFEVNPSTGELFLHWSYSETLKGHLLESTQYTKLSMAIMANLRSLPALSLYEMVERYRTNPSGLGRKLLWEEWVPILKGRPYSDFPTLDYRRFKRETLYTAIAQISHELQDLDICFKEYRSGNKVTHLQLVIKQNKRRELGAAGPNADLRASMNISLFNRALELGIQQYTVDTIYGSCSEAILLTAIEQTEARFANRNLEPLKSPEAYLKERIRAAMSAVDSEAAPGIARLGRNEVGADRAPERDRPATTLEAQIPRIKDEYANKHNLRARAMYQEALADQREAWLRRFEDEALPVANETVRKAYRERGVTPGLASAAFFKWLSSVTWNPKPSEVDLIAFALAEGLLKAAD